jgi:Mrp family chromosome partitioning ATPase
VLVIRVGAIAHEALRRTAEQIEAVKGRILGVVLNSVDLRRHGYSYKYYRYYRAYQGYYNSNGHQNR